MPISIGDKNFNDFKSAVDYIKSTNPDITNPEGYVASIENKQESVVIDPRGNNAIPNTLDDNGQPNIIDYSNDEPMLFGLGENSSHEYPGKIVINNESRYVDREVKRETIPNAAATGEGAVGVNNTFPGLPNGAPLPDHNKSGYNFNQKINWNETEIKLDPMAGDLKQSLPVSQAFSDVGNNPHDTIESTLDTIPEEIPEPITEPKDTKKLGKPFDSKFDTGDDLTRTGPEGEWPRDNYNVKYPQGENQVKLNIATPYYDDRKLHDVSGIVPELQESVMIIPNELQEDIQINKTYSKQEEDAKNVYTALIASGLLTMGIAEFLKIVKSNSYKQLNKLRKMPGGKIEKLTPYDFMRFQYNSNEDCPVCKPLDNLEFWVDDSTRPIVPNENLGEGVYNTHPHCKCSNIPFVKLLSANDSPKSSRPKSKEAKDSLTERKRITNEYLRPLNESLKYQDRRLGEFNWVTKTTILEMKKHAKESKEGRFILAVVSGESYTDHRIEGVEKHRRHWTENEMRQNIRTGKGKLMDINHLLPKKDPYSGGIFDANWNDVTKKGEMVLFETDQDILDAIRNDIITAVSINTGAPRDIEINCNTGECLLEPQGTHLGNDKGVALSYVVTSPQGFNYNGKWLYPLPPGMKFTKLYIVE